MECKQTFGAIFILEVNYFIQQNYAVYNPVKRNTILISDSGIVSEVSFTSVGSTVLSLTGLYLEPETVFTGAVFGKSSYTKQEVLLLY